MNTTRTPTSVEYGTWTETFTLLHHAATTGASADEIRRLEAAELAEMEEGAVRGGGW